MKLLSRRDLIKGFVGAGALLGISQVNKLGLPDTPLHASPLAEIGSNELLLPFSGPLEGRTSYISPVSGRSYDGYSVPEWLDSDLVLPFIFRVPGGLPAAASPSLIVEGLANAVAGAVTFQPSWMARNLVESIDQAAGNLLSEASRSLTWGVNNEATLKRIIVPLSVAVIDANDLILLDLKFTSTDHTLLQLSYWNCAIIWS